MCELTALFALLSLVQAPDAVVNATEAPKNLASLSGTKGNIAYVVSSSTPAALPQATEIAIDLSEVLTEPDPEYGSRRPFALKDPLLTAWMPGDTAARETQMLWPGSQAGQYRAHVMYAGSGFGMLRVDGKKPDGGPYAVLLPLAVGTPKQKSMPARMFNAGKNEPIVGHAQLGKITFNRLCACCHGKDVYGGALKEDGEGRGAPRFHSAETMLSFNEEGLRKAALVSTLERADLISYLAPYRPNLTNFEPKAERYVYRQHAIDDELRTAIRRTTGKAITLKTIALFALYKAAKPKPLDPDAPVKAPPGIAPKTAQRVSEDARDLDTATPDLRVGYFAIVRGASKDPIEELWLVLDNDLKIQRLLARDDQSRPAPKPGKDALSAFEHQGGRDDLVVPKQDRVEKGDALALQVATAYLATRAAVGAYEKDEADRSALP